MEVRWRVLIVIGSEEARPMVYLWLELPQGLLLESTVHHEREPVGVEESLRKALASPLGSAGMPKRIRVADTALATEIEHIPGMPPVEVAPTPELDEAFSDLARSIGGSGIQSYLPKADLSARSRNCPRIVGSGVLERPSTWDVETWRIEER